MGDPVKRFKLCVRAKAGSDDVETCAPNALQGYFVGAVELLERRKILDFRALYSGRVAWQDLDRVDIDVQPTWLPTFLRDGMLAECRRRLHALAIANVVSSKASVQSGIR